MGLRVFGGRDLQLCSILARDKVLGVLDWISSLQNNRVDSSNTYMGLFWFGLASTVCYVLMIVVLRRSFGKRSERYWVPKQTP